MFSDMADIVPFGTQLYFVGTKRTLSTGLGLIPDGRSVEVGLGA